MKTTDKSTAPQDESGKKPKRPRRKKNANTDETTQRVNPVEALPGYLRYDPGEDITRNEKRVDANLDGETLTSDRTRLREDSLIPEKSSEATETTGAGVFDVTGEDLEALGPKDLSLDMNDDEQLKQRTQPVDFAGEDLDVPGSELDDDQEAKGSEDEENNVYSLGENR